MTNLDELLEEFAQTIRDHVTDPISSRLGKGQEWVFTHTPVFEVPMPFIKVSPMPSQLNALAIGSTDYQLEALFQASVVTDDSVKFDINADNVKEDSEAIGNYLADALITLTKTQSHFTKAWILRAKEIAPPIHKDGNCITTVTFYATTAF